MDDLDTRLVVLMRHAAADVDPERYAHHPTMGLSATGRRQARVAGRALGGRSIARLVTSPLRRAQETAAYVRERGGPPPEVVDGWQERTFPAFYGMPYADIEAEIGGARRGALQHRSEQFDHPSTESAADARDRVVAAFSSLAAGPSPVLVVTHGGPHGWLLAHLLGLPDPAAGRVFTLNHTHLTLLAVGADGVFSRVVALNTDPAAARRLLDRWAPAGRGTAGP